MNEKRRAPRFDVDWSLRACLSTGQCTRGRTVNVSASGLQFQVPQHYRIGDIVVLEIAVQRLKSIQCIVRIQRESEPVGCEYCYGAEFSEMSADDCRTLAQALLAAAEQNYLKSGAGKERVGRS